jgi:ribosomal protein S18 acetylase RimI-like enzyme
MFELCDLPAAAMSQPGVCLPEGYTFREAAPDDLPACADLSQSPLEEYRRRSEGGDQCFTTFRDGQVVNLNWLHFGPCYVCGLGLLVDAQPSECYLYNVFTDPAQRGKGLYKTTQRMLISMLARRGIDRVRQVVTVENLVPQLALPKLGYNLTQRIRHRCIGGIKVTTVREAAGAVASRRVFWRTPKGVFRI